MRPGGKHCWGKLPCLAVVCDRGCHTHRCPEAGVRRNQTRTASRATHIDFSVPGDRSSLLGLSDFFNRI